ncbi:MULTISPECIES: hypothetical protein [Agrobacterium tumefaciens complex]|uniref:Uncharacterized protein n=1 Tax=Agrobacterium tomkonis CFBP 6623 TaxID=1183432 RepID=A0A1S7S912_9HYPH|nr:MULTISPECIES: hypothetical protein [Agrobacterium tumefaciens complex]QCL92532.1 hypothetical protein CFBP6623_25365 [Agrobacterium tumefaciens]CUX64400.1 hypothetical protein AGR3A_pa10076 [Agrobacterium tomkonis CFBP 6623]
MATYALTIVYRSSCQSQVGATKAEMIFSPQGHFLENASDTEDLLVVVAFNASSMEPVDDIGLGQSNRAMPANVPAAAFSGSIGKFENRPDKLGRAVLATTEGLTLCQRTLPTHWGARWIDALIHVGRPLSALQQVGGCRVRSCGQVAAALAHCVFHCGVANRVIAGERLGPLARYFAR